MRCSQRNRSIKYSQQKLDEAKLVGIELGSDDGAVDRWRTNLQEIISCSVDLTTKVLHLSRRGRVHSLPCAKLLLNTSNDFSIRTIPSLLRVSLGELLSHLLEIDLWRSKRAIQKNSYDFDAADLTFLFADVGSSLWGQALRKCL